MPASPHTPAHPNGRPARTPPAGPHLHTHQIAEAIDEAWHHTHGTGQIHIPVSVLAALALITPPPDQLDTTTVTVTGLGPAALARLIRAQ